MKIYTKVIYTWDKDKGTLVEDSSESFDYEGIITQCGGGGSPAKVVKKVIKKAATTTSDIGTGITSGVKNVGGQLDKGVKNVGGQVSLGIEKVKSNVGGLAEDVKGGVKMAKDMMAGKVLGQISATADELVSGAGGGTGAEKEGIGGSEKTVSGDKKQTGALIASDKKAKLTQDKRKLKIPKMKV